MNNWISAGSVATVLVLLFAVIGGAMVVLSATVSGIDPDLRLSFQDYLSAMAVAAGGLAIGRGLTSRPTT